MVKGRTRCNSLRACRGNRTRATSTRCHSTVHAAALPVKAWWTEGGAHPDAGGGDKPISVPIRTYVSTRREVETARSDATTTTHH